MLSLGINTLLPQIPRYYTPAKLANAVSINVKLANTTSI